MSSSRAFRLSDGDIFQRNDLLLEYENGLFYEVVIDDCDEFMQFKYKRTGKVFTADEINRMSV